MADDLDRRAAKQSYIGPVPTLVFSITCTRRIIRQWTAQEHDKNMIKTGILLNVVISQNY